VPTSTDIDAPPTVGPPSQRARARLFPWTGRAVVLLVALCLPLLLSTNRLQYLLVLAAIWTMLGYSVLLSYGIAGQLTVAIAAVWGVGAFTSALVTNYWDWSFVPATIVAAFAAALAALCTGLPCLRTRGHYFVIVTFAVAEMMVIAAGNWELLNNQGQGVLVTAEINVFGWEPASRASIYVLAVVIIYLMLLGIAIVRRSDLGRRFTALRESELASRSLGLNVTMYKLLAFSLSGLLLGVAGSFYVYYTHHIDVEQFSVSTAILVLLVSIMGGVRSYLGPPVGALIFFFVPELLHMDPLQAQIAFGLVLCAIIILLPRGVVPSIAAVVRRRRPKPSESATAP
jgi:branched-chain amino acid transport system permease protein